MKGEEGKESKEGDKATVMRDEEQKKRRTKSSQAEEVNEGKPTETYKKKKEKAENKKM